MTTATMPHPSPVDAGTTGFPKLLRDHSRVTAMVDRRMTPNALDARLDALVEEGRTLIVRKRDDNYVVSALRPGTRTGPALMTLSRSITPILDDEYAHGARWEMVRWSWLKKSEGTMTITIHRAELRHGHPRSYELGCHCEECTAANATAHRLYLASIRPPSPPREPKHGAACWKRGCFCEEYRKASRERQRRYRERRRAEAREAERSSAGEASRIG